MHLWNRVLLSWSGLLILNLFLIVGISALLATSDWLFGSGSSVMLGSMLVVGAVGLIIIREVGVARSLSHQASEMWAQLPWLTIAIAGLTMLVGIVSMLAEMRGLELPMQALMLEPMRVANGETYRLLSVALVHAGPLHLGMNLVALLLIGASMGGERLLGRPLFFIVYVGSACAASLGSLIWMGLPAVGASGAIMGLAGATFLANRRAPARIIQLSNTADRRRIALRWRSYRRLVRIRGRALRDIIVLTLVFGIVLALAGVPIDNSAHLVGLLSGIWLAGAYELGRRRPAPESPWSSELPVKRRAILIKWALGLLWLLGIVGALTIVLGR